MKREIPATVKDQALIKKRRNQMIRGAVSLFKQKGFHRTTTREIAKASGFSIGTLYEYIRTKEDVLYLVCDSIYDEVSERLNTMELGQGTIASLKIAIDHYFKVMDDMRDEVLIMYQEAKALSNEALPYVLKKELEMVQMFERLIKRCVEHDGLDFSKEHQYLLAQNIFVQGQMWGFRRWALKKTFTIDDYIYLQTDLLLAGMEGYQSQA
ncbi:TetR family transcriptional regulator [Lederbergia lenta]|uniref:TetR family transcriptional regulator n=2 Tax=Lederbergia lenta TaxID=1467 RepID=A0A2X4WJ99_LEDLE|nr:TetR/AcrR family transcriptional regulator [Lederbergia lenta]SQI63073.1 TetR family transcriptional regulator [Lederbergia lenta]